MAGRLSGKRAIVFGAGSSGPGYGNGKAAAMEYAREGAQVACVDLVLDAANETHQLIAQEGFASIAIAADVTRQASDEAKFITGVCLPVDGGQSCAMGAFS